MYFTCKVQRKPLLAILRWGSISETEQWETCHERQARCITMEVLHVLDLRPPPFGMMRRNGVYSAKPHRAFGVGQGWQNRCAAFFPAEFRNLCFPALTGCNGAEVQFQQEQDKTRHEDSDLRWRRLSGLAHSMHLSRRGHEVAVVDNFAKRRWEKEL